LKQVVIIGGGISGLAAAYWLKRNFGLDVTVLEAAERTGGKVQTFKDSGFTCEEATNGWLDKEPAMGTLIRDLGMEAEVQPCDALAEHRFIYRAGRLHEIRMHPIKFMLSSALPLGARLRLMMEPFVKPRTDEEDETLADFAARRLGKGARDFLIGPMAFGIYAGDPEHMSLRSCFGKVHALEQNHGSLIKGMMALKKAKRAAGEDANAVQAGPSGRLTSLRGGIGGISKALSDRLGASIRTGARVVSVEKRADGIFETSLDGAEKIASSAVVSAAPAHAAARYLASLDEDAAAAFGEIPYPALHVVCLGFRREQVTHDLRGFGFLVPRGQKKKLLGALWTSSIFPGRAPKGYVLVRAMLGGMLTPEVAAWDPDQAADHVLGELRDIIGIDPKEKPEWQKVFSHAKAIPQYHVGHGRLVSRIEEAEARHPGFFATGNAIRGIGLIDCVRESEPLAERIAAHLEARNR
jgi:oxygen-dependent protoporphyrinogen oxidase